MSSIFRLIFIYFTFANVNLIGGGNIPPVPTVPPVIVHKCCPEHQIIYESRCINATTYKALPWEPVFTNEHWKTNLQINYRLVIGVPQCGSRQPFSIFHYGGSADILHVLPDGRLRHYYLQNHHNDDSTEIKPVDLTDIEDTDIEKKKHYDYEHGLYCMDKAAVPSSNKLNSNGVKIVEYAVVCNPYIPVSWYNTDFILRRIIDPACHGIALTCYLAIAIIHFIMQQLRDLVGNILTSLTLCLAIAQVADTIRIFTEFTSPTTFLIADCVLYVCILGAFFWLNSMGYYIWKTFRSRNVFLRITDGRKYCYYSFYVWSCTLCMAVFAVFAHFTLDHETRNPNKAPSPIAQGALGWLGIAVFFTPIAFTILVNIFFYVTTVQIIDRMSTYGRIHHKLKYSFDMFIQIFLIMTIGWVFMLFSWLPYNAMYYIYIFSNAIQAPLFLYASVLSQKRVRFLIRKACCYDKCIIPCFRPDEQEGPEWGEEMMAMNR